MFFQLECHCDCVYYRYFQEEQNAIDYGKTFLEVLYGQTNSGFGMEYIKQWQETYNIPNVIIMHKCEFSD